MTLTAAPPLQRQQIAASERRSNDTDGEEREPANSPSSAEMSAETHRGPLWMILPSLEASQSCVLCLNPSVDANEITLLIWLRCLLGKSISI